MIIQRWTALALALGWAGLGQAAELPFSEIYGNAAGCAIAQAVPNAPAGAASAIARAFVIHKRERCDITDVAGEQAGWRIGIACAAPDP
jgi:hypothetical protein